MKEISYTVGRNPNCNPEIHCEIQESTLKSGFTLKSGNPIQDYIKVLGKYLYTLH